MYFIACFIQRLILHFGNKTFIQTFLCFLDSLVQHFQQFHDGNISCWTRFNDFNAYVEERLRQVQ